MQTTMKRDVAKHAIIFFHDISLKLGISFFDEELNEKKLGLFFYGVFFVFFVKNFPFCNAFLILKNIFKKLYLQLVLDRHLYCYTATEGVQWELGIAFFAGKREIFH